MVTWVGEHCVGFHNGFVGRGADVPASAGQPHKSLNCGEGRRAVPLARCLRRWRERDRRVPGGAHGPQER
jgi:hypothetical protein